MGKVVVSVFVGALALTMGAASAQTLYRYVDKNGRVFYSDKPLTDLAGRPVDQMSKTGVVTKRTPAAPTAEERAAAEEERRRKAEAEKAREVEQRRDLALLATYTSEKEIEDAHAFAVRDPLALISQLETKLLAAEKKRDRLKAAAATAKTDASTARVDASAAEAEVRSLTELLAAKRRDVQGINERFDEDKRRYAELIRARNASLAQGRESPSHTGAASAATGAAAAAAAQTTTPKR